MTGKQDEDGFWAALAACLLHPVKLQIIEAMRWIDRPVSSSQLVQALGETETLSSVSYHVRSLVTISVLKPVRRRPVRGALETSYRLAPRPRRYRKKRSRRR